MNISKIEQAGGAVLDLLEAYHKPANQERYVDPILFAHLAATFSAVTRQHCVYLYGSSHPQRIDFRIGGNNPVVMEFAVRGPRGGAGVSGPQNQSELRKLCRVKQSEARLRALLLMDLAKRPWRKEELKATYDPIHAGPGKFKRMPARVVYVHRDATFNFLWRPFQ